MIFDFAELFKLRAPGLPDTEPKMVCRTNTVPTRLDKYWVPLIFNPEFYGITKYKLITYLCILCMIT